MRRLTKEQYARMGPWAQQWVELGHRTGEADWEAFEVAARDCYRFAGIPWPGVVVRVGSPLVGALAAQVAAHALPSRRTPGIHNEVALGLGDITQLRLRGGLRAAVIQAAAHAVSGAAPHRERSELDRIAQVRTSGRPIRIERDVGRPTALAFVRRSSTYFYLGFVLGLVAGFAGSLTASVLDDRIGAVVGGLVMGVLGALFAEADDWSWRVQAVMALWLIRFVNFSILFGFVTFAMLASRGLDQLTFFEYAGTGFVGGILASVAVGLVRTFFGSPREDPQPADRPPDPDNEEPNWERMRMRHESMRRAETQTLREAYQAVDDTLQDQAVVHPGDRASVDRAVGRVVADTVDTAIGQAVHSALEATLRRLRRPALADEDLLRQSFNGWSLAQLATASFHQEIGGVELPGDLRERHRAFAQAQTAAGWWWPYRDFVIVCDRPRVLHLEPAGQDGAYRLHCDDGPALAWPDGWTLYYLHGVRVPRQVVEAPQTLTVRRITAERNAEVRSSMIQRYGPGRYLRAARATRVDTGAAGTLWRLEQRRGEAVQYVQVVNSTPEPDGSAQEFWLRVPPEIRTAHAAVAWTFGLSPEEYQPTEQS